MIDQTNTTAMADGQTDASSVAPTPKATGQVTANFKSVVDGGELRLHPVVGQLLDKETLGKLGMKRGAKE